jgi:hypothetical protein
MAAAPDLLTLSLTSSEDLLNRRGPAFLRLAAALDELAVRFRVRPGGVEGPQPGVE